MSALSFLDGPRAQWHDALTRVALYGGPEFKESGRGVVSALAFVLGLTCMFGLSLAFSSSGLWDFGWYLAFLSFFHFSEFVLVALFNPRDLTANSFLINHSDEYTLAAIACIVEYLFESWYLPFLKGTFVVYLGVLITFAGMVIRIVGMVTARHNFTHIVQDTKREQHELVTHGIYSKFRHPGYMGWFWYTVGTQIILGNPICIAGFAYASYKFFADRIEDEEEKLVEFFGQRYVDYRSRTIVGIPGIK